AAEVARICGLELDVDGFYRIAEEDPVLGFLVPRLRGLRPTLAPQPFEMLVGSVCAQQVNLPFAFTVNARLLRRLGTAVEVGGHTVYGFPEAHDVLRLARRELHPAQLAHPRQSEYIVGLGRQV